VQLFTPIVNMNAGILLKYPGWPFAQPCVKEQVHQID